MRWSAEAVILSDHDILLCQDGHDWVAQTEDALSTMFALHLSAICVPHGDLFRGLTVPS